MSKKDFSAEFNDKVGKLFKGRTEELSPSEEESKENSLEPAKESPMVGESVLEKLKNEEVGIRGALMALRLLSTYYSEGVWESEFQRRKRLLKRKTIPLG